VILGASTSDGEERALIAAFRQVAALDPRLRLVICPRHPERGDAIEREVTQAGLSVRRRSQGAAPGDDSVWIVDTIGELGMLYQIAEVAFVGGSLNGRGGQNMLEPASLGCPVLVGPDTWNFHDGVRLLTSCAGCRLVATATELPEALASLLRDPLATRAMAARARAALRDQRGASQRSAELIASRLHTVRRQ
jgi:3-deoxy-D-manno-octulosonic-acid transferase